MEIILSINMHKMFFALNVNIELYSQMTGKENLSNEMLEIFLYKLIEV